MRLPEEIIEENFSKDIEEKKEGNKFLLRYDFDENEYLYEIRREKVFILIESIFNNSVSEGLEILQDCMTPESLVNYKGLSLPKKGKFMMQSSVAIVKLANYIHSESDYSIEEVLFDNEFYTAKACFSGVDYNFKISGKKSFDIVYNNTDGRKNESMSIVFKSMNINDRNNKYSNLSLKDRVKMDFICSEISNRILKAIEDA